MKILVVGGEGTIGKEVVALLRAKNEVITVGRTSGDYQANLEDVNSLEKMFADNPGLHGVISLAGDAELAPYHLQDSKQIDLAINSKLRGNVDLIRLASKHINQGGFIIVTTGTASHQYMPGASSVSMALAGLEGYISAIQVEPHNNIRIHAIRPVIITETMRAFNLDLPFSISAKDTAETYRMVAEEGSSQTILNVSDFVTK